MLQKRALHNQIPTTEHTPIKLYDRLILGKTRHNFAVLLFFLREMHDDESIQDALNIVNTYESQHQVSAHVSPVSSLNSVCLSLHTRLYHRRMLNDDTIF